MLQYCSSGSVNALCNTLLELYCTLILLLCIYSYQLYDTGCLLHLIRIPTFLFVHRSVLRLVFHRLNHLSWAPYDRNSPHTYAKFRNCLRLRETTSKMNYNLAFFGDTPGACLITCPEDWIRNKFKPFKFVSWKTTRPKALVALNEAATFRTPTKRNWDERKQNVMRPTII
jgi:hypothetical protein